ncbi:MAG: teichoic acid biosynthesis protein [Firmicutes bacterium]|nr:teichoic acid biosynthesis protein [Bacillota bacterium]
MEIIIKNISWERVFLSLTVSIDDFKNKEFGFYNEKTEEFVKLDLEKKKDNVYFVKINMTSIKNRTFLNNGEWYFGTFIDNEFNKALVADDVAYKFDELSRIFRYGSKNLYAYTVDFKSVADETDSKLVFVMENYFLERNDNWKKRNALREIKNADSKFKKMFFFLAWKVLNFAYKTFNLFSIKDGKHVLIMSETKPFINGNLKAVDDKIKEMNLDKEFKITYSFRRAVGSNQSKISWLILLYKISKQDYIFIDDYAPIFSYLKLDKKTKLIQLWHAGAGFKAVGYCRFGKSGSPYPITSVHKNVTYGVVGAKKLIEVFEEVWGIDKESILPYGMARLDNFLDKEKQDNFKETFYKEYPNLKDKKIILFSPTYRGIGQATAYYDFSKLDFKRINDFCKDKYVFLIKLHPFITEKPDIPEEYSDKIIDFSFYKNINELYYVTDIMITDYSSCYYEFSLMKRPILFYTYDRCLYELSRGVYQNIKDSAPGKVCDTFDELMKSLENEDFELDKTKRFVKENFDTMDNKSSERIINNILLKDKE